jgi:prevent-host-death family protein
LKVDISINKGYTSQMDNMSKDDKMEINAKEARGKLSSLLKRVEKGDEIVVLRRGKQVARLVPFRRKETHLPQLREFRASIRVKGEPLSTTVLHNREGERY